MEKSKKPIEAVHYSNFFMGKEVLDTRFASCLITHLGMIKSVLHVILCLIALFHLGKKVQ